jgi:hypothetical protein
MAVTDCDVIELASDAAGEVISQSPELNAALEQLTASRGRRIRRILRRVADRPALTTGTGAGPSGESQTEPAPDTATPGTGGLS